MRTTQIEKNAAKVAGRLKHDWQNAYVIACSVELGKPGPKIVGVPTNSKVSAQEFARQIKEQAGGRVYGMGTDHILATLKKWDDLATDPRWDMTPTYDLTPEDADKDDKVVFPDRAWKEAAGSEYVAHTKDDDIKQNVKAIARIAASDSAFAEKVSEAVAEAAPKTVAKVAAKAIKTDEGRKAVAKAMVEDSAATAEFVKAEIEHHSSTDEGKKVRTSAARVKAEGEAKDDDEAAALAASGHLIVVSLAPLMVAVQSMKQFIDTAESVDYRADEDTKHLISEYARRFESYAKILREIAAGDVSSTISDADLEALLK